jgi:hypothetical protein
VISEDEMEVVIVYFKALSLQLPETTEDDHTKNIRALQMRVIVGDT